MSKRQALCPVVLYIGGGAIGAAFTLKAIGAVAGAADAEGGAPVTPDNPLPDSPVGAIESLGW